MQLLNNIRRYLQIKKDFKHAIDTLTKTQYLINRNIQSAIAAKRNGIESRLALRVIAIQKEKAALVSSSLIIKIISKFI